MAAITWPSTLPEMREFELLPMDNNVVVMSPFNRFEQIEPRAEWWEAIATWPILDHDQRAYLRGFLLSLREGVVKVPVRDYRQMLGGNTGSLTGSCAAGDTAITVSGTGGSSPFFKVGDMIGLGGGVVPRVHVVTADVTGTSISFWPPAREAHTGSITTRNNQELPLSMRISKESARSIGLQAAPRGGMAAGSMVVRFVEAIRNTI